jgi:protein-L-isoaspartate(D-aspartate) O-methyltransferase
MFSASAFKERRKNMVENQIRARGIEDRLVLDAMLAVPRHAYVSDAQQHLAYNDFPLPLQFNQTISQPYIVGLMCSLLALQGSEQVLEIGTGSGYQTAILSHLARHVFSMELIPALSKRAKQINDELAYANITYLVGDGSLGWPGPVFFDAILVSAGAPEVPQSLLHQLKIEGRMVIPVGEHGHQILQIWQHKANGYGLQESIDVVFVPLKGREGWH